MLEWEHYFIDNSEKVHTFGASVDKLHAIPDKVPGDIGELLECVGHGCGVVIEKELRA